MWHMIFKYSSWKPRNASRQLFLRCQSLPCLLNSISIAQAVEVAVRSFGINRNSFCFLLSSFGFSLFGVATVRKYFSFLPIDFVSFLSFNPFHVFSCQIHPPSPLPSSFPSTWHRHLHHPFCLVVFSPRDVAAAPQTPQLGGAQANFGGPS